MVWDVIRFVMIAATVIPVAAIAVWCHKQNEPKKRVARVLFGTALLGTLTLTVVRLDAEIAAWSCTAIAVPLRLEKTYTERALGVEVVWVATSSSGAVTQVASRSFGLNDWHELIFFLLLLWPQCVVLTLAVGWLDRRAKKRLALRGFEVITKSPD